MGIYTLLQKRPTGYYYRQIVPEDLQEAFCKREIVKSLKTKDPKEAASRHKALAKETDELFTRLRNGETIQSIQDKTLASSTKNPVPTIKAENNTTERGKGKTLRDAYDLWATDITNDKTKQDRALVLERFESAHGIMAIGSIDSGHIVDFKDWLTKSFNWKGRTVNKHIDAIKSLVSCAHSNNWILTNPLYGLKVKASEKTSEGYLPYEPDELKILLLNDYFADLKNSNPAYFWVVLIGLFTGCRIEEICQLLVKDIKESNGAFFFDINQNDSRKSLKTKSSTRIIPLHNELIRMGLLDYLQLRNSKPDSMLFPTLKEFRGKHSHYCSRWFSEYKKGLGFKSRRKCFHSLRGTFKDMCREADITKEMHQRLTGHSSSDVGDLYGKGFSIDKLNQNLQQIKAPIDLSSYHVKTTYQLNPASSNTSHIVIQAPSIPVEQKPIGVGVKDIMKAISLAEAYNRIGSKHHGKNWIAYEMIVAGKKHNIGASFKRGHNQQITMPAISPEKLAKTTSDIADENDKSKHQMIEYYFNKAVFSEDGVTCYYRLEGKNKWYILDEETKDKFIDYPEGLPLSKGLLKDPKTGENKLVDLMINPESLTKFIDEHIYGR
jgi:integrase